MTAFLNSIPTGGIYNQDVLDNYQEVISRQSYRGIASLSHGSKSLTFRTSPNSVMWSYKLNTSVENTYGGRVVQILSTSMEDLKVVIECGLDGWDYAMKVARFMRDMMVDQRDGKPGTFIYTTRNWIMKVFAVSIPFQDRITETTREIELNFKIQEDVSGVITKQTVSAELAKLKDGIGFSHNQFNTGTGVLNDGTTAPVIYTQPNIVQTLKTGEIPPVNPYGTVAGSIFSPVTNIPVIGNIAQQLGG